MIKYKGKITCDKYKCKVD